MEKPAEERNIQNQFYEDLRRQTDECFVEGNQALNTILKLRVKASMLEVELASMYGSLDRHLQIPEAADGADQALEVSSVPQNVVEKQ